MRREQFTFYRSYYEALKNLPKRDQTAVLMAVIGYALDETEPALSGVPLSVFTLIRPTLDSGRNKAKNRMNKRGTNEGQSENKQETNQEQTRKEGEKEKEKELEKEKESYSPPTPSPGETGFGKELQSALDEWLAYKRERREPYRQTGLQSLVSEIRNNAARYGETAVAELIRYCMACNWRGGKEKPTAQSMNDETWKYIREMYHHKEEP